MNFPTPVKLLHWLKIFNNGWMMMMMMRCPSCLRFRTKNPGICRIYIYTYVYTSWGLRTFKNQQTLVGGATESDRWSWCLLIWRSPAEKTWEISLMLSLGLSRGAGPSKKWKTCDSLPLWWYVVVYGLQSFGIYDSVRLYSSLFLDEFMANRWISG